LIYQRSIFTNMFFPGGFVFTFNKVPASINVSLDGNLTVHEVPITLQSNENYVSLLGQGTNEVPITLQSNENYVSLLGQGTNEVTITLTTS
jgi:hypothetical protein